MYPLDGLTRAKGNLPELSRTRDNEYLVNEPGIFVVDLASDRTPGSGIKLTLNRLVAGPNPAAPTNLLNQGIVDSIPISTHQIRGLSFPYLSTSLLVSPFRIQAFKEEANIGLPESGNFPVQKSPRDLDFLDLCLVFIYILP